MIAALVAVFVLSGAAGLIYESLWSRYLGLFVGHSAYAQIIVLVIFLGGMSLGAHLVGRRSERIRRPLIGYAVVELVVGVLAMVFHDAFLAATDFAYASIFPSFSGFGLTAVKWAIAGLLILPQSILLGATFPLMSSGVIRLAKAREAPGRILALLYFSNSLGAAIGVLVAGLWLIGTVGLPGVLLIAGFINVIIAAFVFLLARAHERLSALDAQTTERSESGAGGLPSEAHASLGNPDARSANPQRLTLVLLSVAFGTAVASFIYEIAWIRMLSLVLGSATHSFELMLSAFILGLALGALWIRSRADTLDNPLKLLGTVQWMMGLLAVGTLPLYLMSFDWMATVLGTVASNENGYRVFTAFRYGVSLLIMLPATFCAGMTLPLITRMLMKSSGERAIGTVYAVNTLGSILGVILAGLILMPLVGLKRLLLFGALIDILLGVWLTSQTRDRPPAVAKPKRFPMQGESPLTIPLLLTAFLLTTITVVTRFNVAVLTSGVYRHGVVDRGTDSKFPFYKDGRTATVSVEQNASGFMTLATNGKPDASVDPQWLDTSARAREAPLQLTRDIATQYMLPLISLAHRPRAENIAVIGQGSGITSHVLLGSPYLKDLATIEIEPEMIAGSRHFSPANRRVFEDSRSHFIVDDAKSYFASSRRKFDLIVSEPSNPWVSGVSGLFTQEFYARVKDQLADDGVFGQWLHLYEINDGLVNSVLAAIDTVFPAYEVFFTSDADIIVVASKQRVPVPDWTIVSYPDILDDLRRVVPLRASWFEAMRLGGRDVLHPMLKIHAEPNSDFFPVLDLNAERMRFMHENASGYTSLKEGRFDLVAALTGRRLGFGIGSASPTPEIERSQAHALSARMHAVRSGNDSLVKLVAVDEELSAARLRVEQLEAAAAGGKAPASWHSWADAVVAADADLHGGTAGVIDSAFYRAMRSYAIRHSAPMEARVTLNFLEGIGAWNWPQAAEAARALMVLRDPIPWVPFELFRNGAAAAFIMTRDTANAKKVLRDYSNRADDRFRERMIGSILVQIDPAFRKELGW
jgi:predicted membrane-bound spermidine synthase